MKVIFSFIPLSQQANLTFFHLDDGFWFRKKVNYFTENSNINKRTFYLGIQMVTLSVLKYHTVYVNTFTRALLSISQKKSNDLEKKNY